MITVFSPGRINLIGEHTDYNQGFCLPLTLGIGITATIKITDDQVIRLSSDYEKPTIVHQFSFSDVWERKGHWVDYCLGVILEIRDQFSLNQGFEIDISSNLPACSGLSSSAALEVSVARALAKAFHLPLSPKEIGLLSQRAENKFVGVNCGVLDQLAIAMDYGGSCQLIDARDLSVQAYPFQPPDGYLVIINSQIERTLVASAYNTRRFECEQAVQALQKYGFKVSSLREVSEPMLNYLPKNTTLHKRAKHVMTENSRVLHCWDAIQQGNWRRVGKLWNESHESLRQDYEVSCPALDFLVSEIQAVPDTFGCRMTGAGFGGCVIALTPPTQLNQHWGDIAARYNQRFGVTPRLINSGI